MANRVLGHRGLRDRDAQFLQFPVNPWRAPTADFARGNRVATWRVGGLNFQIEHHLFPRISHVHYPGLSALVEQTCREFGVRYATFRSFRIGLVSHFRWLRRMGR
jgi:linoleoyl-CoA desaturase